MSFPIPEFPGMKNPTGISGGRGNLLKLNKASNIGCILVQYWSNVVRYRSNIGPILANANIGPTLANVSLQYWSNIVANIGPTLGRNIGPISCVTWDYSDKWGGSRGQVGEHRGAAAPCHSPSAAHGMEDRSEVKLI